MYTYAHRYANPSPEKHGYLCLRGNAEFLYSQRDISFRGANSFNIDTHLLRDTL